MHSRRDRMTHLFHYTIAYRLLTHTKPIYLCPFTPMVSQVLQPMALPFLHFQHGEPAALWQGIYLKVRMLLIILQENESFTETSISTKSSSILNRLKPSGKVFLLGSHIVHHISPVHHMHSNHTEQAAFAVLKSPYIPSVLIETSFITNPQEEKLLGTTAFRNNKLHPPFLMASSVILAINKTLQHNDNNLIPLDLSNEHMSR